VSGRRSLGILAILAACACAGPGAGPPALPEATRPLAICLYNTLKTMPGIVAVDAFVQEVPRGLGAAFAVIGYWVRDASGKPGMSMLDLSGPNRYGEFVFSLDQSAEINRYFDEIYDQLASKCHAVAAYNDPVLIFSPPLPPRQKVDMARYTGQQN
jgi:hypothetical protein